VLIIGMVLLVMVTLVVLSAFSMSSTNLKTVGNLQARDEAYAAASRAIEQVISSAFTTSPVAQSFNVDLNNDGVTDYTVAVAAPVCVQATQEAGGGTGFGSSAPLGFSNPLNFQTVWNIEATVNDTATGASVRVHQGVRVLLSQVEKELVCP